MGTKLKEKESEIIVEKTELKTKSETKKRDVSVDLIRLFACLSVIAIHLCLQVLNQCYNRIDWSRLLEKSFLTDGVPLFFMITGFFIVSRKDYKKIWKSAIMKVLIPTFIYILFAQMFLMFILNKESLKWCFEHALSNSNLLGICRSFLTGDISHINSLCEHLWYIFSYVKIIIWIPVLWLICKEEKTPKLARRTILSFGILATIITDIQRFVTIPNIGALKVFELVDREILYVLLGYELFVHKDKIKNNKKLCISSIIGFFLINFIRYKIEVKYMVIHSLTDIVGRENFMEWRYTCLNIASGLLAFMAIYSFKIENERISEAVVWLSDKTFGVYLIHYLLLAKIDLYKFEKIEKFYFEILYLVLGTIITFALSVLIVYILRKIKEFVIKYLKKIKVN